MKKNEIYEAEIIDYTTEGSGICRIDGMAVFVPNTAVGDRCEIRIVKTEKRFAYGRLEKLLSPSPDRVSPDCGVFGKCGGCTFRHISYEAELRFKRKRVFDALTRIGNVDGKLIGEIVGSERSDGYRNKAQLPLTVDKDGRIRAGFFAPRSHRVVCSDSCALQSEDFALSQDTHPLPYLRVNCVVQQFDEFYDTYGVKKGDGMYLAPEARLEVW